MSILRRIRQLTLKQVYALAMLSGVLALTFTMVTKSREVGDQPEQPKAIRFSHSLHVEGAGLECATCHESAATSKLSSENLLAKKENCQSCHEEQLAQNCTYCHTSSDQSTYAAAASPQRELVFSHEAHVGVQKMDCVTCHTNLEKEGMPTGALVPAMATCNTCHNDVRASNTCETCHTDLAGLRPVDHNRTDFVREHKQTARLSTASCASCHTQESCIDCHNGTDLVKVDLAGRDPISPRSPRLMTMDRGKSTSLLKVHDLNFRFTHGIAAQGKAADCQTCHSQQQFCATCHAAGGNVNQVTFKPTTHQQAGFVTIGVGTGGGLHAQLARRDMETCASCHDAQGADPTCVTCHMDSDGFKGTDPKTHTRGFMAGVNGDWHSDPGANCFTCHSDANARVGGVKGTGFCGYCHK